MTDPAVEAAQRAWIEIVHNDAAFDLNDFECQELVNAARETLKPIREQWELLEAAAVHEDAEVQFGMNAVLGALESLIFTTEELER